MSQRSFFARRLPFFGNRAMLIMCAVFFLLPFVLRGAREAIDSMKNDVADWLPSSFVETTELRHFREYFAGDQFVVVSWEGCNKGDARYRNLLEKIRRESQVYDDKLRTRLAEMDPESEQYSLLYEELEARDWATEIGLHTSGNYYEDWGEHNEKWLVGKNKQWYFIRQDGSIFKWNGQNNLIHATGRLLQRFFHGKNKADGTFEKRFGSKTDNRFYKDPALLSARFFLDVTTGPEIFEKMAGEGGNLRVGDYQKGELSVFKPQIETHNRLTGVLFGPTPDPKFDWTLDSFLNVISKKELIQLDEDRKDEFRLFVDKLVEDEFGGDIHLLQAAPLSKQLEYWYQLWQALQIEAPPRQTCLIVTLNEPVLHELARAVGRPVLAKPRGRILELATGQCGIKPENLHIGGPPVDNVAIDEEGSITLFRLVSLSALIGFTLAYLSFRSIRVTLMLFFVGGVAAISSLAFVWFAGSTMDAILMTMPSLVYVLGLSGAVHVVNYYKDACHEKGEGRAADIAVKLGWFPCTLAAFTTALGLISLYTSNLVPIKKFGLFSAIATLATVTLLFTYLPSSLTIWPPGYGRRNGENRSRRRRPQLSELVGKFWDAIGGWVVKHHAPVSIVSIIVLVVFAYGVTRVDTTVQLLKLFRSDAKVLKDYAWMEENLGKLVPMELLVKVDADIQQRRTRDGEEPTNAELVDSDLKLDVLQRMELSDRVRRYVLRVFGEDSRQPERRIVGNSMSTDVFSPLNMVVNTYERGVEARLGTNAELHHKYDALLEQDYLRVDKQSLEELWRISLRLAALNNVDYGQFVSELKTVVEPVLSGYRHHLRIIRIVHDQYGDQCRDYGRVLIIGPRPSRHPNPDDDPPWDLPTKNAVAEDGSVNQSSIFVDTLRDLLENSGFRGKARSQIASVADKPGRFYSWIEPSTISNPQSYDTWIRKNIKHFDCVLQVENHELIDKNLLSEESTAYIDAGDHRFEIDPVTKLPLPGMLTAAERKARGDEDALITTTYTGIVPIVYKAQRALLGSLIKSICLAFVMIAIVMMILLRPWGEPLRLGNALNFRAGLLSMLPNVFPVVVIFGAMGHANHLVDIGSMMTASVAMGVAVDDTIHFLNWFRHGINQGYSRLDAIKLSYQKVATAMTQTTLIGGFGLSAFAFSTFMPTQRFGILMLFLLAAALVGDLILLPALLAGPLGKYFCPPTRRRTEGARVYPTDLEEDDAEDDTFSPEKEQLDVNEHANVNETGTNVAKDGRNVKQPYMLKRQESKTKSDT